jgi:AAA domain/VirE N-terminal domain
MTAAQLLKPCPTSGEGVSGTNGLLVSCVDHALSTATSHYDPRQIIESIRADKLFCLREPILKIRNTFANALESSGGDRKPAKKAIADAKKRLPGVMWSGTFRERSAEKLLEHSGLLCADLDELGGRLPDIREKLLSSPHVWALFPSPTGDGLKCVFRVAADAEKHKKSFLAIEQHVRELCGVQIDGSCKDVARLCFLSHDPEVYCNDNAIELAPVVETEVSSDSSKVFTPSEPELARRREIAAEILGNIGWKEEAVGFCTCPGEHLHTTGEGVRDCRVTLDGAPTIHCFHTHCSGLISGANRELRSRIGKAERALTATEFLLPEIVAAEQFLKERLETPAELVKGLIHRSTLTMLGGGSKCYKTFTVLDLALSISQGVPWWGRQVVQGRVLFLNFEIAPALFQHRVSIMLDAKALSRPLRDLDIWNLRGCATDIARLSAPVIERCKEQNYALVIVDPIYKLMGNREENSNSEMAAMLNFFEQISEQIGGAAIVFCHHFTKGLASTKAQIDRVSGGGVFGRHPDGIITLTPHEEENAFVVEATLRNFPTMKPFALRWDYPLLDFAPDLDPKKLRGKPGATPRYTVDQVVACLVGEMTTGQWEKAAYLELGLAHSTFATLKNQAVMKEHVVRNGKSWSRNTAISLVG